MTSLNIQIEALDNAQIKKQLKGTETEKDETKLFFFTDGMTFYVEIQKN